MNKTRYIVTLLLSIFLCSTYPIQSFASNCENKDKQRFIVSEGTTFDSKTGLFWMTCPLGLSGDQCEKGIIKSSTWLSALNSALESTFEQFNNWRLPSNAELLSIVETNCEQSARLAKTNITAFPNTPASFFWSSTKIRDNSRKAHAINFSDGLSYEKNRFQYYYIRLVRTEAVK